MTDHERLTERIRSAMCWGWTEPSEIAERLIEDGDVIVSPCKIGDAVYVLEELVIYNKKCESCEYYDEGGSDNHPSCIKTVYGYRKPECIEISEQKATKHNIIWWLYIKAFGRTVFLTREEAETVLLERKRKYEEAD